MTQPTGSKPRLDERTEAAISKAWDVDASRRLKPEALTAQLQASGHVVSVRTVNRRYAAYAQLDAVKGSGRWRLTDAHSAEELALILPAVVTSAKEGRELSKDEAAVFLAFRRALPQRHLDFLLYLTHHYDRARRGETDPFAGLWLPYTVDEIEEWVAFAHLDQEQPGTLEAATEAGYVRNIDGWVVTGSSLAEPLIHSCGREFWTHENYVRHEKDCDGTPAATKTTPKRKGGTGHDKTRQR